MAARSRALAAAASSSTSRSRGKQPAATQDDVDDQMDELDLVEDSDPEDDRQDELDLLPPPLRSGQQQSQASSSSSASRLNGHHRGRTPSASNDIAAAMPTPTLGPDEESDADCMKVRTDLHF